MRIGGRWRAGDAPPPTLPAVLREAIDAAEACGSSTGGWTLTWLEDRPVAEHDDGTRLVVAADGSIRSGDDDAHDGTHDGTGLDEAGVDVEDEDEDEDEDDLFPTS